MPDLSSILAPGEPTLLTGGGISEGPLWHPGGYVTFVRLRLSQLVRWDPTGAVTVIRENTGTGNGCTLDREGRLVMCELANRRVSRTEPDGSIVTIAERWQGKRINKPNDVICRSDGMIYFTDPQPNMPPEAREVGFSAVFRRALDGELHLATDECEFPNGLAFSPDEKILYVAITRTGDDDDRCGAEIGRGEVCTHRKIRAFDVAPDGGLSGNRVFAEMFSNDPGGPDGMKVDTEGRVYCTGSGGIWVFEPNGRRVGIIRFPEICRNLAFGGPDFSTLYVTAGESLYRIETKVRGIGAF